MVSSRAWLGVVVRCGSLGVFGAVGVCVALGAIGACSAFSASDDGPSEPDDASTENAPLADAAVPEDASEPDALVLDRDGGPPPGTVLIANGPGAFFIDANEVTNGDYEAFVVEVERGTYVPKTPPGCTRRSRTGYRPPPACTKETLGPTAKGCADWCEAYAYCKYRGKRLCGKVGGGPAEPGLPTTSQWSSACTAGGTVYPYGNAPDAGACGTKKGAVNPLVAPPRTYPACVGGAPGLFDMSGNVWEWEDACIAASSDGGAGTCLIRGGSVGDNAENASCSATKPWPRTDRNYNIGFRCCSDP